MELKKYKLGEILDVTRGASLSGKFYAAKGEYVRLTCGNFDYQNNCFKENKAKDNLYYIGDFKPDFLMKEGDIITPLTEQAIGLLGSTAIIPESGKYIQSQDVAKIVCKEHLLDKDFAFYLISSNLVKQQLSAAAQQTKIRHTSPDKIKDCIVWIPELEEQKRIGKLLRTIDLKIELNRQLNHNLEAMAKQLYDYWFVQFDFPDENGKPYKSSGGKMVWDKRLKREIPLLWKAKIVEEVADVYNGATPSTVNELNYGGDIVWITPKDLSDQKQKFVYQGERNISQVGYDSCSTHLLPSNTILMSSRAPIGLLAIAKTELCTNQGFKSFVSKSKNIATYLYYYLQYHITQIEQLGTGTTFKEVSREDILKFPMLKPSDNVLDLWEEIVSALNDRQLEIQKENENLIKQRDELLPLLMNGQVSVNYDLSHD
ncbi:restriction endonuclease subunit S [Bacteroides stercoris]|jgi:type I restriction enzyme S subunit|uniref:restriction endonuclease subunit S n=5 Tax=Bacteroides stercoris TaxID=46506 RepID=UPI00234D7871|nr:restriction endonuclease subunit S [Bacteroides stercoris]MDC7169875.1 restriction endonuclease subunit S [Bacteroides stercoris]